MKSQKIVFFKNCILVKGHKRATLNDLQRKETFHISMEFYDFCKEIEGMDIDNFNKKFKGSKKMDYYEFLVENEIVTVTDLPELFPPLSTEFNIPFDVSNGIIDISENYEFALMFANQIILNELNTNALQIRVFSKINYFKLNKLIDSLSSWVYSLHLVLPYENSMDELIKISKRNANIEEIIVYRSPKDDEFFIKENLFGKIKFTEQNLNSENDCGNSISKYFTTNIKFFNESLHYNNCLNKKLCLDKNGFIKNCPSMNKNFGHILDVNLATILNDLDFKYLWSINKDKINDCKVCEFRYVCFDCRAFTIENNIYSKPRKCNYNPYEGSFS